MNAKDVGSSFGGYFTRTFSTVTFLFGMAMSIFKEEFYYVAGPDQIPYQYLTIMLIVLGAHGMLTDPKKVWIIRQGLCYLGGVAGGVLAFNVLSQIM